MIKISEEKIKITKNFTLNTIGSTLNAFNSFFILVLITRINGLEKAGIFSIAFATASILYVLAIYSGRNCHITDIEGKISDKEYIIARIISCITTAMILFLYVLLTEDSSEKTNILIILCLWKILEAFSDVLYAILQKNDELYKVGISLSLKSIIGIGSFCLCNLITKNLNISFSILYITNVFIVIIYDIPNILRFIEKNKHIKFINVFDIYKKEFWIFCNTFLIMYIVNEPKYVIEKYLTNDIQAIFNIILIPASIVPLFSQFIMAPVINDIKNLYKEKNFDKIKMVDNKITLIIFSFGIFAASIGYLIGIPVLEWIYSQKLDAYKIHLVVLLLSYTLYAMAYVKTIVLTTFRKLKEQFTIHIISTLIVVILSITLINAFAATGVTITYFTLMSFYYMLMCIVTKKVVK